MQPKIPLIHAENVAKVAVRQSGTTIIFNQMTVTLPSRQICAILGRPGSGRTTFLRLISGVAHPDRGRIVTQTKFSVIANTASFFHVGMTGLENITLAARMHGLDASILAELTLGLSNYGSDWEQPVGALHGQRRKAMEMLVSALLPYDCYLIDDIERVDRDVFLTVLEIIRQRRAGMIFTGHNPKFARLFATCAGVIDHQTVYAFPSLNEAVLYYAR